jgi:hypothetical protein
MLYSLHWGSVSPGWKLSLHSHSRIPPHSLYWRFCIMAGLFLHVDSSLYSFRLLCSDPILILLPNTFFSVSVSLCLFLIFYLCLSTKIILTMISLKEWFIVEKLKSWSEGTLSGITINYEIVMIIRVSVLKEI